MIRYCLKKSYYFVGFLPFNLQNADTVSKDSKTAIEADISIVKEESGWDRIKRMFTKDEFGTVSPELNSVLQVGCMSMFVGALYGGVLYSRESYIDFIKNNQASVFKDHFEAKKRLQDHVTLSFAKGAYKWATRLTFFCTSYMCISTSMSVYRGDISIVDHLTAGLVSGAIYKFNMGPRGWIVGGGLGFTLGAIAGGATILLLKLTGMSMDEMRYWQYKWRESRNKAMKKCVDDYMENELTLLTEHNKKVGDVGKSLDNFNVNISDVKD